MNMNIGVIKGDGIGPEIVDEAMKVLDQVVKVYGHTISYTQLLMGGASIDVNGVPLTEETLAAAKASDAVLMGSIGGDAKTSPWYQLEPSRRPEAGLLQLRKGLNLFANLRPAVLYEELKDTRCKFCGAVDTAGYTFDSSIAVVNGKSVGLPLDEVNEDGQTDERISAWVEQVKQEIS